VQVTGLILAWAINFKLICKKYFWKNLKKIVPSFLIRLTDWSIYISFNEGKNWNLCCCVGCTKQCPSVYRVTNPTHEQPNTSTQKSSHRFDLWSWTTNQDNLAKMWSKWDVTLRGGRRSSKRTILCFNSWFWLPCSLLFK